MVNRMGRLSRTICIALLIIPGAAELGSLRVLRAETPVANPTPEIYVNHNKGGSEVVPNGHLAFDGQSFTCRKFPTVLDPQLNDYAAAPYKRFMILNLKLISKLTQPVRLWVFFHECAHLVGIRDETKVSDDWE
jgi:hypothetical protein